MDPDPGGPKTSGSGSATLALSISWSSLCTDCSRIRIRSRLMVWCTQHLTWPGCVQGCAADCAALHPLQRRLHERPALQEEEAQQGEEAERRGQGRHCWCIAGTVIFSSYSTQWCQWRKIWFFYYLSMRGSAQLLFGSVKCTTSKNAPPPFLFLNAVV